MSPDSIQRWHLTSIGNPTVEIRRSYGRLISTMVFPILVRWHLYIESGARFWSNQSSEILSWCDGTAVGRRLSACLRVGSSDHERSWQEEIWGDYDSSAYNASYPSAIAYLSLCSSQTRVQPCTNFVSTDHHRGSSLSPLFSISHCAASLKVVCKWIVAYLAAPRRAQRPVLLHLHSWPLLAKLLVWCLSQTFHMYSICPYYSRKCD